MFQTLSLLLLLAAGQDFDGTWVLHLNGQNIFKLTLKLPKGTLTKPRPLELNQDGDVTAIGSRQVSQPVQKAVHRGDELELTIDGDVLRMKLIDRDHATLTIEGLRPLKLDRVPEGTTVALASKLIEPEYPPEVRELRAHLKTMVKADQDARLAFDNARMEKIDANNRAEVMRIFEKHGWITNSLAGKDAAHDFWLLVQHQDSDLQRRMLPALEAAAKHGDASMSDYAYLYDRVQVGLGKPQRWGTQVKCEAGKPVLNEVEDRANLDARRKELFMIPIAQYLDNDYLRKFCASPQK